MTEAAPGEAFGRPLAPVRPPLCPEIELWLLAEDVDLERVCRDLDDCHPPPYWAFCWGAGQALARFVIDRPEHVRGRAVVDFGCGGGVAAIAAALAGAASVTAVDADPAALEAVAHNAARNAVEISGAATLPARFDVLLAADVLYEDGARAPIEAARAAGHPVVIADPERAASPDVGVPATTRYAVRTLPDVDSPMRSAAVFLL